ncbi:MAG: hypothetical protein PUF51_02995 [Bifidobacteriaceae bacterium]|nr:hypothetical protein [Bifidobacteriaceae bacterium]
MSVSRQPRFTLSQQEADFLIKEIKNTVESIFVMPQPGERNSEFHVPASNGDYFTIAVFQGARDPSRHQISARISQSGIPLLRLCVNATSHHNPDGTRVGGTHWHIYREGFDDLWTSPASLVSDSFLESTISLLNQFNVIEKPMFQRSSNDHYRNS